MENLSAIIETILFAYGEPLSVDRLAELTGASKVDIKKTLGTLQKEYTQRGFVLLEKDEEYQLASNPAYAKYIETLMKGEFSAELSRAALETLAIVIYKGPITKADIEYIRGVNSAFSIRNLLLRGLLERIENPKDARSYLYRVSFDTLKHFGLTKIQGFPKYEEFHTIKIEIPEEQPPASESHA